MLANQPDTVVINKNQKSALIIDKVIPRYRNDVKKEYEKLKKNQILKKELESMWKMKSIVPIRLEALNCGP